MRSKPCLTLDDVFTMVAACRKAGQKVNEEPTVAIVDAGGALMYLERPDQNSANTVNMATGKARTAAMRGRPSSAMEARVKERPGFLTVPGALAVRGGVPVFYQGLCVGGVGVSGNGNNDEPIAQAGADALQQGDGSAAPHKAEQKKPRKKRG
jgi:glc operon protein GlcG